MHRGKHHLWDGIDENKESPLKDEEFN